MIDLCCPPALKAKGFRLEPESDADQMYLSAYFIAEHWPMVAPMPWDDMQKKCLLAQQFVFQHKSYHARFPDGTPLVIKKEATPVGRIYLAEAYTSLHVVDILLAQNWRGHGIGTSLMQAVQNAARLRHIPVTLSVDRQNQYAGFYRKLGFIISGTDDIFWTLRWPAEPPQETRGAHPAFRPLTHFAASGPATVHALRRAE